MENLELEKHGVISIDENEMRNYNGGFSPRDWLIGKAIDVLIYCAQETHERGTLMNMHQANPKLWG
jgi:hypothetical protein